MGEAKPRPSTFEIPSHRTTRSHKLKLDSYLTNTHLATLYAVAHSARVQRRFEVAL